MAELRPDYKREGSGSPDISHR